MFVSKREGGITTSIRVNPLAQLLWAVAFGLIGLYVLASLNSPEVMTELNAPAWNHGVFMIIIVRMMMGSALVWLSYHLGRQSLRHISRAARAFWS